jgi:hypothetical protein
MSTLLRGWRIAVLLSLSLLAACVAPPKRALDPAARNIGERDAIVIVAQGEIRAIIQPSTAGAASGGLIGALIDVGINQIKTNSAEAHVRPIRDGLAGYDFDRRALEAARVAAAQVDWLNIRNVTFTKDSSNDQVLARFDQSAANQFLVVSYSYLFSPNFAQLSVALRAGLYPKTPPQGVQPAQRLARGNELYEEQFVVLADVPSKPDDTDANVAYWGANNAQAARAALDTGIAKVQELLVRSLSQSPEAAAALDQGAEARVSDRRGALIERSPSGTLIYQKESGTWVFGRENAS